VEAGGVVGADQLAAGVDVGELPVVVAVEHGQLFARGAEDVVLGDLEAVLRGIATPDRNGSLGYPVAVGVVEVACHDGGATRGSRARHRADAPFSIVKILVADAGVGGDIAGRVVALIHADILHSQVSKARPGAPHLLWRTYFFAPQIWATRQSGGL